jgi:hypothetical protein
MLNSGSLQQYTWVLLWYNDISLMLMSLVMLALGEIEEAYFTSDQVTSKAYLTSAYAIY